MLNNIISYLLIGIKVNLERTLTTNIRLRNFLHNTYTMPRKRTGRRKQTGGNLRDVLGKVNDFFKKHHLLVPILLLQLELVE